MEIKPGAKTKTGYTLIKKITSLDQFWSVINNDISLFARHKMTPTAFFFSWNIRLIKTWILRGWFYEARK